MRNTYNVGLDIGTNSVGWSVTDDNYQLMKFKKKNMWGVRLFQEGKTAKERRVHRSTRRRLARRKQRIVLLRNMFEEDILKVDPILFIRLEESFLYKEDRTYKEGIGNLFVGKDFNDKEYYKKYPTIYHLRKRLMESNKKEDIRLIYLAVHHMIKYRGNFLYEGQNFNDIAEDVEETINILINEFSEREIVNINISVKEIIEILKDQSLNKTKKVEEILKLFNGSKEDKKIVKEIFSGIVGLKFKVTNILTKNSDLDEDDKKFKITFIDDKVDDNLAELELLLGEDYTIVELMKKIYSWVTLREILEDSNSLSKAMIYRYEKFKKDLRILKDIVINNFPRKVYIKTFKDDSEKNNFANYMNNKCKNFDFGKYIVGLFEDVEIGSKYMKDKEYILKEIEDKKFLIKQNNTSNASIPYQLNENELRIILDNQSKYYSNIKSNKEKILKLLTFRVPYYVGPLNTYSKFSWMKRKEGKDKEAIYPWNFEDVVDIDSTAVEFITRMTNYCTYLPNEKVIPKWSLLYSEYMFYDEINKIRVDGKLIKDFKIKEKLRTELFLKKKSITEKDLVNWLRLNQISYGGEYRVEGLHGDKKVEASLKSFIDFNSIFGEINSSNRSMIEKIIFWLTIYEDKKIVNRRIENEFKEITKEQRNKICKLKYEGWSRLSEKLLTKIFITDKFGNKINIINQMKYSNMNFMQVINDNKLKFNEKIKEENNSEEIIKIDYENHIKTLQGSPAIKRGVWQSVQIIDEIIKIMKCPPEKIFIEFAKSDEDSKRTVARKNKLIKLYQVMDANHSFIKELKDKDTKITNERQFLYYIQHGKCMYTGEPLELDSLYLYDVDHIIPQSYIKDDSIDNKVLVKKKRNQEKSDEMFIAKMVSRKVKVWWDVLYKYGFISAKKYRNLKAENFTEGEEKGFINRQLVETRQISKHVADLLNRAYGTKGTKIVTIKAQLNDDFKTKFNIYKNRSVNDYHHAKDAYIVSVIGSYISKRFPSMDAEFIYDQFKEYKNKSKGRDRFGFIISSMGYTFVNEDGKLIWEENNTIAKIKKTLGYKDFYITKKTEENTGQMFKINALKKIQNCKDKSKVPKIPLKKFLDVAKYGGYNGEQDAYFAIFKYTKVKEKVKKLIGIPIRVAKVIDGSNEKLEKYLEELGYNNPKILKNKILKYQLFENDEGIFYLAGEGEWHNAKQLIIDKKYEELIYDIEKNKKYKNSDELFEEKLIEFYQYYVNKVKIQYPIFSKAAEKIEDCFGNFVESSLQVKTKIVKELLKLTSAGPECSNLKDIKGGNRIGRIEKKVINVEKSLFINQSITGLFEKKVRY